MTNLTTPNGKIYPNTVKAYFATLVAMYNTGNASDCGYHPYLTNIKIFEVDFPLAIGSIHVYPDGSIIPFVKGKVTNYSYTSDGSLYNRI
jgi:hypothetical protein